MVNPTIPVLFLATLAAAMVNPANRAANPAPAPPGPAPGRNDLIHDINNIREGLNNAGQVASRVAGPPQKASSQPRLPLTKQTPAPVRFGQ
ncbi:hypothetical protein BKA63DRAFT_567733 [Paraphoma chrysanthemicola]|nr:hypothetical protein BKA63DRAFT_567733 [Paraphoma chrysanthemicola]